jgi:hypothetical protein
MNIYKVGSNTRTFVEVTVPEGFPRTIPAQSTVRGSTNASRPTTTDDNAEDEDKGHRTSTPGTVVTGTTMSQVKKGQHTVNVLYDVPTDLKLFGSAYCRVGAIRTDERSKLNGCKCVV